MPRYELRNTTGDALSYVEGDLPLNIATLVGAGTYRAKAMSAEEATDIVVPTFAPAIAEASLAVDDTATLSLNIPGDTYQWRRNGSNISGATSATYTVVSADAGTDLTCLVDPQGPQGAVETAAVSIPGSSLLIDEDFSGLADAADITSLSGWEGVFAGNGGRFLGDGTGLLRVNSSTAANAPQVRVRNTTVLPTGVRIELDFVEPPVPVAVNSQTILGIIVRQSPDADTGYEIRYASSSNATVFDLRVSKRVAGSASTLGDIVTGEQTLGFTLAVETTDEGSDCRIKVFVGATEVINRLDTSSPLTGTRMGLFGFHQIAEPTVNQHTHLITAVRAEAL